MRKITLILAFLSLLLSSCKTQEPAKENIKSEGAKQKAHPTKIMSITGILDKQDVTTYQYGSHSLKTKDKFYALHSDDLQFDEYVGKKVKIIGESIAGYPISGGPVYIKVLRIELIKE